MITILRTHGAGGAVVTSLRAPGLRAAIERAARRVDEAVVAGPAHRSGNPGQASASLGAASWLARRSSGSYFRPYRASKLALPSRLALIMKPTSAALASGGTSILSVFSAWTVKI